MAPVACCQGEVGQAGSFEPGWGWGCPNELRKRASPLPGGQRGDPKFPRVRDHLPVCLSIPSGPRGLVSVDRQTQAVGSFSD